MSEPTSTPAVATFDDATLFASFERADGWIDREWLEKDLDLSSDEAANLLASLLEHKFLEDHGGERDSAVFAVTDEAWARAYPAPPIMSRREAEAELYKVASAAARINDEGGYPFRIGRLVVLGDYPDGEPEIERLLVGVRFWSDDLEKHRNSTRFRAAVKREREAGVDFSDVDDWVSYFKDQMMDALQEASECVELIEYSVEAEILALTSSQVIFDALCRTIGHTVDVIERRVLDACDELAHARTTDEARAALDTLRELASELGEARRELLDSIADTHVAYHRID